MSSEESELDSSDGMDCGGSELDELCSSSLLEELGGTDELLELDELEDEEELLLGSLLSSSLASSLLVLDDVEELCELLAELDELLGACELEDGEELLLGLLGFL